MLFWPRQWSRIAKTEITKLPIFERLKKAKRLSALERRQLVLYEFIKARSILSGSVRKYVWGLDLSLTGTGFCAIDLETKEIYLDKYNTVATIPLIKRSAMIASWLGYRYMEMRPSCIIMEGAFIPFNKKNNFGMAHAVDLNKLNHLIEFALYGMGGALYRNVPARSIKKYAVGQPSASKEEIRQGLCKERGIDIEDNDMSDAFAMALMAFDVYRLLTSFDFFKYNVTDAKEMLEFEKDLRVYLGPKYRAEVFMSILGTSGLSSLIPEIDRVHIKRKHPIRLRYGTNSDNLLSQLQLTKTTQHGISSAGIK